MALNKPAGGKPRMSTEEYVQSRINAATENGFNSTKMWVKNANSHEAKKLLADAGFAFKEINIEKDSVQLEIKW